VKLAHAETDHQLTEASTLRNLAEMSTET